MTTVENAKYRLSGSRVLVTSREFAKLLSDWGWIPDPAGAYGGGHDKWRWNGRQVNFKSQRRSSVATSTQPRKRVQRAAELMGLTIAQFLAGATLATVNQVLALPPRQETIDLDDIDDVDDVVIRACPRAGCQAILDDRNYCLNHGLQVLWPAENQPLTMGDLEAWTEYQPKFTQLDVEGRRAFLRIQNRLRDEGLLTEADVRSKPVFAAGTPGARSPHLAPSAPTKEITPMSTTTETRPAASKDEAMATMRAREVETIARRRASAPPVGQARTIDEVLDRSQGRVYPVRREVLEGLVECGGVFRDAGGGATARFGEYLADRGYKVPTGGSFSSIIRAMIEDRLLQRTGNLRRSWSVALVDPLEEEFAKRGIKPAVSQTTPVGEDRAARQAATIESRAQALADHLTQHEEPTFDRIEPMANNGQASVPSVDAPNHGFEDGSAEPTPSAPLPPAPSPAPSGTATGDVINQDTVLEVAFIDRSGRIFLQTDDGRVLMVEQCSWV